MTNKLVANKPLPEDTKKQTDIVRPGMMGDGTEEQNLSERGNPAARITEDEVKDSFGPKTPKVP